MTDAAQLRHLRRIAFEPDEAPHLPIAILIDDVYAVVGVNEVEQFLAERVTAQPQIRGVHLLLVLQLVARLDEGPVRGAIGDEADAAFRRRIDFGLGN